MSDDRAGLLPATPSTADASTSTSMSTLVCDATPRNDEEMVLDDELCASGSVTDDEDVEYGGDRHHVDDASASSGSFECEGESLAGVHVRVEVASVEVDERAEDSDDDAELVTDAVRRWQDRSRTRLASARRVSAIAYSSPLDGCPETAEAVHVLDAPDAPHAPADGRGHGRHFVRRRGRRSLGARDAGAAASERPGAPPSDRRRMTKPKKLFHGSSANFSDRCDANVLLARTRERCFLRLETPQPVTERDGLRQPRRPRQSRRWLAGRSRGRVRATSRRRSLRLAAPSSARRPRRGSRQVSRTAAEAMGRGARAESRDGKHPNRLNRLNRFPTRLGGSHVGGSFLVKDATNDAAATRSEAAESRRGDGS